MANIPNMSDGNVLIAKNLYKIVAFQSSGGTTSSTSFVQVGSTLSISAGQISEGIVIFVNITASTGAGTAGGNDIRLKIGQASSETVKVTWTNIIGFTHNSTFNLTILGKSTISYHYIPTAAEISNGFNIIVEALTNNGAGNTGYTELIVVGV